MSVRANFKSAYLDVGGFTLETIVTNTSKKATAKIMETDIRLIDADGNIINPIPDRLAQTIEIKAQSDGLISTFFEAVEPEFIASVEVIGENSQVIASYDFDSTLVDYGESEVSMETAPQYVAMTQNGLVLWNFEFQNIDGISYLVGVVENVSNSEIDMVSVSFDLFDNSGFVIGTSSDSISSLGQGQLWKFKAPVFEDGVYSANFKELSSW